MLTGKRVFISGGTGHVGSEICRACHEYGAKVIYSYHRNHEAAQKLLDEIPGSRAVSIDLLDVNGIRTAIEKLYEEVGVIDVLVNNAAISQIMPLPLVEEEDVDLIMDINIKGTLFVTKHVLKGMIRNKSGAIVNLGSIAGMRMLDVPVTYAMTKAAISGFTFALAAEVKRFGIRVNAVVPGLLDGGVGQGVPEALKEDFISHCAAGRAGTAREVAELVCFLASDRASYINGQNISVDGGI
ncbi:MAG TPA: SDR family NAD(P)-dependent oxidoreductase [Nitrospirota bacterium]|nr:SDR family NAD(P)-dependent oxidoreductase [Nitrospirota bacterium]